MQHPYFPQNLVLNDFIENDYSVMSILAGFFIPVAAVLFFAWHSIPGDNIHKKLTGGWFLCCGFIHTFFEGYYVLNASKILFQTK